MVNLLQLKKSDVSFVLTNDETIHELNKNYRGKDKPTDVLAFAMHEGEFGALAGDVLGDVIVSVPTAAKQARAARKDVLSEVTMLLAHGLLHLLGWDHDTAAKDRKMKAETERLCVAAQASAPARSKDPARRATPPASKATAARRTGASTPAKKPSSETARKGSGAASRAPSKAGAGAALKREGGLGGRTARRGKSQSSGGGARRS